MNFADLHIGMLYENVRILMQSRCVCLVHVWPPQRPCWVGKGSLSTLADGTVKENTEQK